MPVPAGSAASPQPGARERKKARTRLHVQNCALELFTRQGYEATTIEQIAAAAGISPATFFRYFSGKEHLVLHDVFGEVFVKAFRQQPPSMSTLEALKVASLAPFADLSAPDRAVQQARYELLLNTPALRAKMLSDTFDRLPQVTRLIARREGKAPTDAACRMLAGAFIGTTTTTLWRVAAQPRASIVSYVRQLGDAFEWLQQNLAQA